MLLIIKSPTNPVPSAYAINWKLFEELNASLNVIVTVFVSPLPMVSDT